MTPEWVTTITSSFQWWRAMVRTGLSTRRRKHEWDSPPGHRKSSSVCIRLALPIAKVLRLHARQRPALDAPAIDFLD
jgi:hypothetical protein